MFATQTDIKIKFLRWFKIIIKSQILSMMMNKKTIKNYYKNCSIIDIKSIFCNNVIKMTKLDAI